MGHNYKQPYLMTKSEWREEFEKCQISHGQMNFTRSSASNEIHRINKIIFLCFGVCEWICKKAITEEWAKEAIEYGYDTYDMIIIKAKEDGLL